MAQVFRIYKDIEDMDETLDQPFIITHFITPEEEVQLLQGIFKDNDGMYHNERRSKLALNYGAHTDVYNSILYDGYDPLPGSIRTLCNKVGNTLKLLDSSYFTRKIYQDETVKVNINIYGPDSSLRFHHDNRHIFDEAILGVSMVGDCTMVFKNGPHEIPVKIPRYSLYIMAGKFRYKYKHGIPKGNIDENRVSITIRTMRNTND